MNKGIMVNIIEHKYIQIDCYYHNFKKTNEYQETFNRMLSFYNDANFTKEFINLDIDFEKYQMNVIGDTK